MQLKITKEDVNSLTGKFIIQINSDTPNVTLTNENWQFYKEKRISFVCGLSLIGFYYKHISFDTTDEFVMYFNDNITSKSYSSKGERFHRLLSSKEIDFLCKKLKEDNYNF